MTIKALLATLKAIKASKSRKMMRQWRQKHHHRPLVKMSARLKVIKLECEKLQPLPQIVAITQDFRFSSHTRFRWTSTTEWRLTGPMTRWATAILSFLRLAWARHTSLSCCWGIFSRRSLSTTGCDWFKIQWTCQKILLIDRLFT